MLKGFEEDFEGLELSDEIKTKLIDAANKRAGGLVSKNTELLEKISQNRNSSLESQSAAAELSELKAQRDQQEQESKKNYDSALNLNSEKYTKQINELSEKIGQFETKERNSAIGKSINDTLNELRVNPLYSDMVTTHFKQQAQLVDGKVMIGETSLSDAAKAWSETDQGKAVRLAPDNSGGNSNGGTNKAGSGNAKETDSDKRANDINKRFGK
jgi:hypothetical protein